MSKVHVFMKNVRELNNVTQGYVAQLFGYSTPQFISNIERGLCSVPISLVRSYCELFDIEEETAIGLLVDDYKKTLVQEWEKGALSKEQKGIIKKAKKNLRRSIKQTEC